MPSGTIHPPTKPIHPFVHVRTDERTTLYSHKELCALTSADPRNELDELSEPLRYKKDVTKPDAYFQSEGKHRRSGRLPLGALVALAVPSSSVEFSWNQNDSEILTNQNTCVLKRWLSDGARGVRDQSPQDQMYPTTHS
jgi:hypothetical protein